MNPPRPEITDTAPAGSTLPRTDTTSSGAPTLVHRGPMGSDEAERLRSAAAAGATVIVIAEPDDTIGAELTGCGVVGDLPRTEWFVTLVDGPAAARLDGEVPITSPLRLLDTIEADAVATTSVRFRHHPTLAVRALGAGRIITSGVVDLGALDAHGTLGPYLRRLERPTAGATTDTLGVAVVGYGPFGGMGYLHGLAATETEGLRFAAAVDTSAERLAAAERDFPGINLHRDATALGDDASVDIVIVATPPVMHAPIGLELLRAGKHVVVEKPMCLTAADADEMLATAAAHERVLSVHQSRRWDRDVLALGRTIDDGLLGEVFNIETFVGGFDHPCRAWHSEESVSGGAVYDWGSHHIDWILRFYGGERPRRVMTSAHTRVWLDSSNADQLSVWMQWDDGHEATFRQSDIAAIRRPKFYVQGTAGTLEGWYRPVRDERVEPGRGHLDRWHHHAEAPVELSARTYAGNGVLLDHTIPTAPHPGWGFHRNLADHLLLGEELAVAPEQSRDVVEVLEAAHRSGHEGGTVIQLPDRG